MLRELEDEPMSDIERNLALHSAKYHTIFVKAHVEPDPHTSVMTLHIELPVEALRAISPERRDPFMNGMDSLAALECFKAAGGDIWEALVGPNATIVGTKEEQISDIVEIIRARWSSRAQNLCAYFNRIGGRGR